MFLREKETITGSSLLSSGGAFTTTVEVEQWPGECYEMHQFNTVDSQGREERARSEPLQVIHSFGVSMMHCGNSWCRMSAMVEVCFVQWYQMWWCDVVLVCSGSVLSVRCGGAMMVCTYIVHTQYNELTCHCHTVSMKHHPQVLCTGHRAQTCRSVGGWEEGEERGGSGAYTHNCNRLE